MRKISKTLALMSLLAPLGANALGIGDIRLHSALNQSLNAEIPLVTSGSDELADIRVTLAPPEAFSRAGIERHHSLSKLRFTPQQKADGTYIIKVSSQGSIREPFLNFMIEVHWPQGRLQREFTVLLDPPASFQEDEAAEADLPDAGSVERPTAQPIRRTPGVEPVSEKPRKSIGEVRVSAAPQAPVELGPVTGTQYGPISRNETLWGIAKQYNQDASVNQDKMMRALYKANPQAFYKNNPNALKAGETITIPDRASVVRLTGAISAPPTFRQTGKLATKTENREAEIPATGEPSPQGQLKLLAPAESGKSREETANSGARGKSGKSKEDIALEVADTVRQENEEIRKSLADLKEQLSGMQRLLSLKDEQIAALQAQQKQLPHTPAQPVPTPSATDQQQPVATQAPTLEPAKAPPIAEPSKETPRSVPVPQPAPEAQITPPPLPKPVETVPAARPPAPPAAKPPAQAKPKQPAAPAKEEEGILAELLDHPTYAFSCGFALLFVAALWLIKRRRAAMIEDTESILTFSNREKMLQAKRSPAPLGQQTSGISEQTTTTARSSFLSEFTPSDFDALGGEMEEVDPISEADVYLAYGRYKQAEELIQSAIAQNPERDECKLKLLEIHYATENAQAFEEFAKKLAATHKKAKPEFWEKVAEMGQELCPDSPLFDDADHSPAPKSSRPGASASLTAKSGQEEEDLEDYLFQTEGNKDAYAYPLSPVAGSRHHDTSEEAHATAIAYDFFSTEPAGFESSKEDEDDSGLPQYGNVIAFDKGKDTPSGAASDIQDKSPDDILAELNVLSDSTSLKPIPKAQEPDEENDGLDFGLGYGQTFEADEADQFDESSAGYMALAEMDEQETKLDLAKAYFDMGDGEAARAILEDVTQHGNDTQKEEAWSLLNKVPRKEANRR